MRFNPTCLLRSGPPADRRGFALEATLVVLVLITALVGFAAHQAVSLIRSSNVDYRGSRTAYAAEGGADAIMAQLEVAMQDGIINQSELDALTLPSLSGFTFGNLNTTRVGGAVAKPVTSGPFAGLYSLNQRIDIDISATDPQNNNARVIVGVNAQSIPIFQFGVFYEGDLEIHPGQPMDFTGWVHTNGNLYVTANTTNYLKFHSLITTPNLVIRSRKPVNDVGDVRIDNASAVLKQLTFDSRDTPDSAAFRAKSNLNFDGRLMTGALGVTPLRLPLPPGVPAHAMVEPRSGLDDAQTQSVKFAWKADWHITVDLNNLGTVCASAGAFVSIRSGSKVAPNAAECALIFTGRPNGFWEGRENVGVDVLDIDVGRLRTWINGAPATRGTQIMYITFANWDTTVTTRDFPAIRLRNAGTLPGPLTIATDRPVYFFGNFNLNTAGNWQPASVLGDSFTILSGSWTDAGHAWTAGWSTTTNHGSYPSTAASNTEVWAAVAAGHSPTPCDWTVAGCTVPVPPPATGGTYPNYGGGLENFPRFLENWSGRTVKYRGSLVSLFDSQYANRRRWSWQTYYGVPTRDWMFDLRFQDPNNLPPGTPTVGSVIQTSFRAVF